MKKSASFARFHRSELVLPTSELLTLRLIFGLKANVLRFLPYKNDFTYS